MCRVTQDLRETFLFLPMNQPVDHGFWLVRGMDHGGSNTILEHTGTIDLAMNLKSRRSDVSYVSSCPAQGPRLTIRAQHELVPFAFSLNASEQGMRGNREDVPCGPKGHAQ